MIKLKVMKLSTLGFLFIFLHGSLACQSQDKKAVNLNKIDSIAEKAIQEKHIPSFAIGVVKDGRVVYSKAFGYANLESKKTADTKTLYQLGSVTKTMTGHVLAHLIENRTVSLSDTLAKYFPDSLNFPKGPNGEIVTVQHLATHSAGFPRYPANLERVDPNPIRGYTKEQLNHGIEMVDIETVPGQKYHYSNFGYGVLATALENATGQSFDELLDTYVFKPMGMVESALQLSKQMNINLAIPYLQVNPYKRTEPWQMGALSGAGNIFSNIDDMNKFLINILQKDEINQLQQTPLLTLQANNSWHYGLGCFVIDSQDLGTLRIHHGGDVDGYASTINLYPEYDLGLVIMTNNGDSSLLGKVFAEIRDTITATYINTDIE